MNEREITVSTPLPQGFFERDPVACARGLIGSPLLWRGVGGVIVETEAYAAEGDEACHTFFRPSARAFVERHEAGAAYVYFNYGMYWLANVLVKGGALDGFVLIRALEPRWGVDLMRQRRGKEKLTDLCSGPGKLTRALAMDGKFHGQRFTDCLGRAPENVDVLASPRIGISRATDLPWRFTLAGNPHVSAPPK